MQKLELRALWRATALSALVLLALLLMYLQKSRATAALEAATRHRPLETPAGGYVASDQCRSCHPEQYASWRASYHSTMTQIATPQTVRGDFSDVALQHGNDRLVLSRQGDQFGLQVLPTEIPAEGSLLPSLPAGQYPVSIVTGSHHMQVYWYETGRGRELGQLPFAYLHDDARWVPRAMVFLRPPDLLRAGETGRWNSSCLHCHATRAEPQLDPTGNHDTRVVELGIACEACHGPAERHVSRYSSPLQRYASHLRSDGKARQAIVNPAHLTADRASQICSQCHAIWQQRKEHARDHYKTGIAYRPGQDPEETMWLFAPSRRNDDRVRRAMLQDNEYASGQFWSDGQARISGREYNGMIESPCMHSGKLSCLSCHDMHKKPSDTRAVAEWANDQLGADKGNEHGDAACLSCHKLEPAQLTAHTRHAADSPGSRCYNCHMPHTSWGLLTAMRTHRIGSPSVQETLETGRPNACTLCHLDQSLSWTARMLSERFGVQPPRAEALAATEHSLSAGVSLALLGDAGQRALIASAMGRPETQRAAGQAWMPAVLGVLMDDPYDAVRYAAGRSLRTIEGFEHVQYDFVPRPDARAAIAQEIAKRSAARVIEAEKQGTLSKALPVTSEGVLSAEVTRELLGRRDARPVHLLE
ncbi:MAG TPA: multiheme c-type cytochrome [Polyangiales bacterium]|nr:multiheme c-type cytochrome [Polyangiales bacterium]